MPLIVTQEVAEALYGDHIPPDVIVTIPAPARWPLDKPWPPEVRKLNAPPCWKCFTGRPR